MRRNLAARAGHWSAAHWKTATLRLAGARRRGRRARLGRSGREPDRRRDVERGHREGGADPRRCRHRRARERERARAVARGARPTRRRSARTVRDVRATLAQRPEVAQVARARRLEGRPLRRSLEFDMQGPSATTRTSHVAPVLAAVANLQRGHPDYRVEEFGGASADHALNDTIGKDFAQAERLSVPLTFLILLFAFGAFVAAGVPVLLALSAVLGSVGVSALASHVFHASQQTTLRDPADGHGGRRRLLALLREARARGACGGHASATRCSARRRPRGRPCSSPASPC